MQMHKGLVTQEIIELPSGRVLEKTVLSDTCFTKDSFSIKVDSFRGSMPQEKTIIIGTYFRYLK